MRPAFPAVPEIKEHLIAKEDRSSQCCGSKYNDLDLDIEFWPNLDDTELCFKFWRTKIKIIVEKIVFLNFRRNCVP